MKRLFLNIEIAYHSLHNFRLRTCLAMFGVLLGTFSLVVVANLTGSLEKKTKIEVDKVGKNLLIVRSGIVLRFGERTRLLSEATTLKIEDAQAILDGSLFIEEVAPSSLRQLPVKHEGTTLKSVFTVGASPNLYKLRNYSVKDGVFFGNQDMKSIANVTVIGHKIAKKLFGDKNPIGKYILISDVYCQVIGVLDELGSDISGADQDNQVIVPLTTFMRKFVNKDYINMVFVKAISDTATPMAKSNIEQILKLRHKIKKGEEDDFTVIDMKDVMSLRTQAMSIITTLGRISATISFLIGGLGILSIMILIVNERKMEIGIRRAVGSRKRDIIFQFLTESSAISLAGGTCGVFVGFAVCVLIFHFSKLPYSISYLSFFTSFFDSFAVGILAGLYPAKKATTFQPIDVLRS